MYAGYYGVHRTPQKWSFPLSPLCAPGLPACLQVNDKHAHPVEGQGHAAVSSTPACPKTKWSDIPQSAGPDSQEGQHFAENSSNSPGSLAQVLGACRALGPICRSQGQGRFKNGIAPQGSVSASQLTMHYLCITVNYALPMLIIPIDNGNMKLLAYYRPTRTLRLAGAG